MNVVMQLLGPDVVFRHHTKPAPKGARKLDPLSIPADKTQCVHATATMIEGKLEVTRCVQTAEKDGRQGWLCRDHQEDAGIVQAGAVPERDIDAEIVEHIIKFDGIEINKLRERGY